MAIVRWDPFSLMRWPTSLFDSDDWQGMIPAANSGLDVYETKDAVVVKANIAGVPDDKVEITFEKGMLWIRGEAEEEEKEGRKYYSKTSRAYSYKIAVPGEIDLKQEPKAEIEKGVVVITFQKAEEQKPKRIEVTRK